MRKYAALILALLGASAASQATAQDWEVNITPYIWVAFPKGDVTVIGRGPGGATSDGPRINASYDDVKLTGVFTGSADVSYDRFGVFGDLTFYEFKADDITLDRVPATSGELKVSGAKAMLVGYWRAYETEQSRVDLLAGAHYLGAEAKGTIETPNRAATVKVDRDLWDPVIGIRGETRFGEHFGVKGLATYGGFGVSSDSLYELQGYATWRFSPMITALAGYRYYSTDWGSRFINYDASFSGPLVGLNFRF